LNPQYCNKESALSPPFNIFEVQSDGRLRWMESAGDMERAKAYAKKLAASSPGEYIITGRMGEKISIKSPVKRIMFQIGYDEKELNVRAELFRRFGHEVISVADNDAAKHALASIQNVDVFIVGHAASEQTRKEMVNWLKTNFPRIKIVALVPPGNRQLESVDYSVVLNDWNEWLLLLEAATG
jgi:hypothetical protein